MRRAFLSVPRERFLSEIAKREGIERVYQDQAIVTAYDERLLLKLIEGWKERGRPTGHDLRVEVSFRGRASSCVRLSWGS